MLQAVGIALGVVSLICAGVGLYYAGYARRCAEEAIRLAAEAQGHAQRSRSALGVIDGLQIVDYVNGCPVFYAPFDEVDTGKPH